MDAPGSGKEETEMDVLTEEAIKVECSHEGQPLKSPDGDAARTNRWHLVGVHVKIALLSVCWLFFVWMLLRNGEKKVVQFVGVSVPPGGRELQIPPRPFVLLLNGPFRQSQDVASGEGDYLFVSAAGRNASDDVWRVAIVGDQEESPWLSLRHGFPEGGALRLWTSMSRDVFIRLGVDVAAFDEVCGVIYATMILIALYVLIIFDIVHRTFAAILMSTLAIGVLAMLGDRPTMEEIVSWIDYETLMLLFSMMTFVSVMSGTGIFDYFAVRVFRLTRGRIWALIHGLCLCTLAVSAFLDNVTTILLMTPVTMRLCEVMRLKAAPVLMAIVIHANIGGTVTPVGDPPNVIITSNHFIATSGVTFLTFTWHMATGVIFVVVQTLLQLRLLLFRDVNAWRAVVPEDIEKVQQEVAMASASQRPQLRQRVKKLSRWGIVDRDEYMRTVQELESLYSIRNKPLLIKSTICLAFIIILFFVQSIPTLHSISVAWVALLGMLLLLILHNHSNMEELLASVEWATLLFFAAMFILIECLNRLGLIRWIGRITEQLILAVPLQYQLAMAIVIILWVSALVSAFVDSIPVTTMMVRIVVGLAQNAKLQLPLQPLVWALAFGPCLGGNGTLFGASANVVCAALAQQRGHVITFRDFFIFGFPLMLGSVVITTAYLLLAHVVFSWH
ncbi:P protein-like [Phlebotomus argentipes]|uniref:P protein-like n=1 Tax=Phlebotomus argentipes TaxID=94469 RepID=UPI002892D152|nr:P protein-like [Phlebotomus argentipes]